MILSFPTPRAMRNTKVVSSRPYGLTWQLWLYLPPSSQWYTGCWLGVLSSVYVSPLSWKGSFVPFTRKKVYFICDLEVEIKSNFSFCKCSLFFWLHRVQHYWTDMHSPFYFSSTFYSFLPCRYSIFLRWQGTSSKQAKNTFTKTLSYSALLLACLR